MNARQLQEAMNTATLTADAAVLLSRQGGNTDVHAHELKGMLRLVRSLSAAVLYADEDLMELETHIREQISRFV